MRTKAPKQFTLLATAIVVVFLLVVSVGSHGTPVVSAQTTQTCDGWINPYEWVSGQIARVGQQCQYTFSGRMGQLVTVNYGSAVNKP